MPKRQRRRKKERLVFKEVVAECINFLDEVVRLHIVLVRDCVDGMYSLVCFTNAMNLLRSYMTTPSTGTLQDPNEQNTKTPSINSTVPVPFLSPIAPFLLLTIGNQDVILRVSNIL